VDCKRTKAEKHVRSGYIVEVLIRLLMLLHRLAAAEIRELPPPYCR
jgi:hypothetical protein